MTVDRDCSQGLSAVTVNNECQQRLSAVTVNSVKCENRQDCPVSSDIKTTVSRILKSALTVKRDCQHWVSTKIVSRILKSAVTVNRDCQHWVSTTIVSRILKSAVTVNRDEYQQRLSVGLSSQQWLSTVTTNSYPQRGLSTVSIFVWSSKASSKELGCPVLPL